MNKKGFTLVELLAVIALVSILSIIAIPNVVSTINNSKKNTFLTDAKRMVSKAEYLISLNKTDRSNVKNGNVKTYTYSDLNEKGEFSTDADNGSFDSGTYVKVTYNSTSKTYQYCIYVMGSKRHIGSSSSCVSSSSLNGINIVEDN